MMQKGAQKQASSHISGISAASATPYIQGPAVPNCKSQRLIDGVSALQQNVASRKCTSSRGPNARFRKLGVDEARLAAERERDESGQWLKWLLDLPSESVGGSGRRSEKVYGDIPCCITLILDGS